jgi:hypothetical protein
MDDTGTRQEFPGGGMRDTAAGKERFELLWTEGQPYEDQMLTRAARWMARGAEKYDSRNWELFDSPEALEHAKASLLRHTYKLLAGNTDEDHAAAVWFNSQVIEYVRWKLNQKLELEMMADGIDYEAAMTPQPRYFRVPGSALVYQLLPGDPQLTYKEEGFLRRPSVARYYPTWDRYELPINQVPEWAR